MPSEPIRVPLEEIAARLNAHGVEFLVIGGQAETLMGSPRVTYDVDICYRRTDANMKRLATALSDLSPRLRGVAADLPFVLDARTLGAGLNFTLTTTCGDLDLLGEVVPIGDFAALEKNAESYISSGIPLRVIALEDLIRVKEHIKRPKDAESLYQLKAIQQSRRSSGLR